MDFLSSISNLVVPRWVKATIGVILLALLGANIVISYIGLTSPENRSDWIEAGAYLLGVLLPILLLALIALYAETGTNALRHRSYKFLTVLIPEVATILDRPERSFSRKAPKWDRLGNGARQTAIEILPTSSGNMAYYRIISLTGAGQTDQENDYRSIVLKIQLNVHKAAVILYLPSGNPVQTTGDFIALFPHTLEGARLEGYDHNASSLFTESIDGHEYKGLVLMRLLPDNFISSPAHRLYFAQDLMVMIWSALNENPSQFEAVSPKLLRAHGLKKP